MTPCVLRRRATTTCSGGGSRVSSTRCARRRRRRGTTGVRAMRSCERALSKSEAPHPAHWHGWGACVAPRRWWRAPLSRSMRLHASHADAGNPAVLPQSSIVSTPLSHALPHRRRARDVARRTTAFAASRDGGRRGSVEVIVEARGHVNVEVVKEVRASAGNAKVAPPMSPG